jgi:hypothetical protein
MERLTMATTAPRFTARVINDAPTPARRKPRIGRTGRLITMAVLTVLIGIVAFIGGTGGQTPSSAGVVPGPFCAKENPGPFLYRTGTDAMVPLADAVNGGLIQGDAPDESWADKSVTAYEWYGTNGLTWTQYEDDCWEGANRWFGTTVGNILLDVSKGITTLSVGLYQWASSPDLLKDFLKPVDCMLTGCNGASGLKDTLYLNFLTPIVLFGSLWVGYQSLIKQRTIQSMQGAGWMLGSALFALLFLSHPSWVAEKGNSIVSTISSTTMAAVTSTTANAIGEKSETTGLSDADMCSLPDGAPNAGPRIAACSIYKALLYTPWASGQFGFSSSTVVADDSGAPPVTIGNRSFNDIRLSHLEALAVNHDEARSGDFEKVQTSDDERWMKIKEKVDANKGRLHWATWAGEEPNQRMQIGFATLVASFTAGALIALISFSIVVMAMGMLLLILMAPLFLLIGAHPGFGRGIALKWLEMLIGTVMKRVVLGFLLAVLIGFYQIILSTQMAWFAQIAMILAVGVGAIIYRKPMLEALNVVSLGGTRTGIEEGLDRQVKRAASGGVGAIAGGALGATKGGGLGGFVQGAFSGGVSGSRSGSPLRAGTVGAGAGRRVAGRNDAVAQGVARQKDKEQKEQARANDPLAYDRDLRKKATEDERIQNLVDEYQDDPEMQRRLKAWAASNGRDLPTPRPKTDDDKPGSKPGNESEGIPPLHPDRRPGEDGGTDQGGSGAGPRPDTDGPTGSGPTGGGGGGGAGTGGPAPTGRGTEGGAPRPVASNQDTADALADMAEDTAAARQDAAATRDAQQHQAAVLRDVAASSAETQNASDVAQRMLRKITEERNAAAAGGTAPGGPAARPTSGGSANGGSRPGGGLPPRPAER